MNTPAFALARPIAALLVAVVVTGACGGDDAAGPTGTAPAVTPPVDASAGAVLTFATFARVIDKERRISDGLDIDGEVSGSGDENTCNKRDYRTESGEEGVDNQFGELMPVIERFAGSENIGALLEAAIANGQLLNIIALEGLDDPVNDPDVTLKIGMGRGAPLLDTIGKYIPNQTFGFNFEEAPISIVTGGRIENGVLTASTPKAVLPVRVLDADFNLGLTGVKLRFNVEPHPAGGVVLKGLMAGAVGLDEFRTIINGLTISDEFKSTASFVVGSLADLDRDPESGRCRALSAALRVETTPAFILRPPADAPRVE